MNGGFPGKIWIKIVHHLTHIPLADTHAPPERARKWRPDHGEAIVPSVAMATPVSACQLSPCSIKRFQLSVTWAGRQGRQVSFWQKQTYTQKPAFLNFRSGGGGGSVQLQKVVWEVCFCTYMCHVVLSSGLRGIIPLRNLLAPSWPASSAICCHEALSHRPPGPSWASTGLLKFGCHEDKRERRCSSATCVLSSYHASMETLSGWGCSVYALRSIYSYMLGSKSQFRPDRTSLQVLAAHGHHLIMYCWLSLLQTGFDCIKSIWVFQHCALNYCLKTSNHLDFIDLRSLWTCEILK